MKKELILLANSIRTGNRCICGREVIRDQTGSISRFGNWIRPVTLIGEGAVPSHFCRFPVPVSRMMQPLDIIEIKVTQTEPDGIQNENWILDLNTPPVLVEKVSSSILKQLEEKPTDLWNCGELFNRRVREDIIRNRPHTSMMLIRPENLRFESFVTNYCGSTKRKRNVIFDYAGQTYTLPCTDPAMDARYYQSPSAVSYTQKEWMESINHPKKEMGLDHIKVYLPPKAHACFLMISLGSPFKGYCYKIVAGVHEVDERIHADHHSPLSTQSNSEQGEY